MRTIVPTLAGLIALAAVSAQAAPLPPAKATLVELGTNHHACYVATRPVETGDESSLDRVNAEGEDDRDGRGRRLGGECRRGAAGGNHCHLTTNQIGRQGRQSIVLVLGPTVFDRHILTFDVVGLHGSIYKATSARLPDPSTQRRLAARAEEIGKRWPEFPVTRTRAVLVALIERIEVSVDQIEIRLRPRQLNTLLDVAAPPIQGVIDDETEILSVPVRLRRAGREIRMVIDGTDPFAASKPDARLIKLLLKAHRFNASFGGSDDVPFAALAEREGVSPSYFTRLVRLSYLAPDITHAILDGRQPRDLTAEKLLDHSRLPLAWHDQRTALGFA